MYFINFLFFFFFAVFLYPMAQNSPCLEMYSTLHEVPSFLRLGPRKLEDQPWMLAVLVSAEGSHSEPYISIAPWRTPLSRVASGAIFFFFSFHPLPPTSGRMTSGVFLAPVSGIIVVPHIVCLDPNCGFPPQPATILG